MALASPVPFSRSVRELVRLGSLSSARCKQLLKKCGALDELIPWASKKTIKAVDRRCASICEFGFDGTPVGRCG